MWIVIGPLQPNFFKGGAMLFHAFRDVYTVKELDSCAELKTILL